MPREILTAADVLTLLRRAASVHGSQAEAARALGISPPYFHQLLTGKREIERLDPDVLRRLGLEIRYVRRAGAASATKENA